MRLQAELLDDKLQKHGYKFLGWQNGWNHVYFDKDGNVTTKQELKVSAGYLKKDYPEYVNCQDRKHTLDHICYNNRGSENIVSCNICKIYWKYDCSD